jgi:hypothetical protein
LFFGKSVPSSENSDGTGERQAATRPSKKPIKTARMMARGCVSLLFPINAVENPDLGWDGRFSPTHTRISSFLLGAAAAVLPGRCCWIVAQESLPLFVSVLTHKQIDIEVVFATRSFLHPPRRRTGPRRTAKVTSAQPPNPQIWLLQSKTTAMAMLRLVCAFSSVKCACHSPSVFSRKQTLTLCRSCRHFRLASNSDGHPQRL